MMALDEKSEVHQSYYTIYQEEDMNVNQFS